MNIVKLKTSFQKCFWGRIILRLYHYLIAVPMSYIVLFRYKLSKKNSIKINFYSDDEVFEMLISQHKSLTRFGDGEIAWIYRDSKGYFGQENSEELSISLRKTLNTDRDSLLVGIPNFFNEMETYTKERKRNREIHLAKYLKRWGALVDYNRTYADSLITRVYNGRINIDFASIFNKWKTVWDQRYVCIIEGSETRFGVGNDLLSNARCVERIICPAENAFSKYKEILSIAKMQKGVDLFLIALGPTASVLADDLDGLGYQSIDIGHLDIEYEWFLNGAHSKTPIAGKYVNEAGGAPVVEMDGSLLAKYQSEIIAKVE